MLHVGDAGRFAFLIRNPLGVGALTRVARERHAVAALDARGVVREGYMAVVPGGTT